MNALKNIISISLTASILSASFSAYGNEEICKDAFQTTITTSTSITKSITVREHFKKLGLLKSDNEIQQLSAEDKELYLTMLKLDYSRAQEIMRLFATFPIITSPAIRKVFYRARKESNKNLKDFIADSRKSERKEIAKILAVDLYDALSIRSLSEYNFILTKDFENLESTLSVERFKTKERIVEDHGIPAIMIKEIALFFNQVSKQEQEFIESLFYRNFNEIAIASEPLHPTLTKTIAGTQAVATTGLSSGIFTLGLNLLGASVEGSAILGGGLFLLGSSIGAILYTDLDPSIRDKFSLSGWVNRTKQLLTAKMKQKKIKQDLLALSGLDPKSIKPLPTVQQLKKQPNSSLAKSLIPALQDPKILAYPELDLNRFEESLEQQISIEEIDKLEPSFDKLSEVSKNPFVLISYGIELTRPQNLVIGREEVLAEKFRQISERMGVWQNKRNSAKSPQEKSWVTNEKSNLTELLSEHSKDNGNSWTYLTSLKNAVIRFDDYLVSDIKPHAGASQNRVDSMHEIFQLVIFQIDSQFSSLEERAKAISTLMDNLKI